MDKAKSNQETLRKLADEEAKFVHEVFMKCFNQQQRALADREINRIVAELHQRDEDSKRSKQN